MGGDKEDFNKELWDLLRVFKLSMSIEPCSRMESLSWKRSSTK